MPTIHPSSIVERGAELAEDVYVGPFCMVGKKVVVGSGTRLLSHVVVTGRTTLGEHNTLYPQCVIGAEPQDLKYQGEDTQVIIGSHNELRECVTVHRGTVQDAGVTSIGGHNLVMAYAHVAHDCRIADHCIIANAVQLAGHIVIEDHVTIGGASAIHHFATLGTQAFIGGMTRITTDVPPYMTVEGNPAEVRRVNTLGLKRRGFSGDAIAALEDAFRRLYARRLEKGVGKTTIALQSLEDAYPQLEPVQRLIESIRRSQQGLHGRYLESTRTNR